MAKSISYEQFLKDTGSTDADIQLAGKPVPSIPISTSGEDNFLQKISNNNEFLNVNSPNDFLKIKSDTSMENPVSSTITGPLKSAANLATFPVRTAKNIAYDIPKETFNLVKETGIKAPLYLAEGAYDAVAKPVVDTLNNVGNTLLGAFQYGIKKATGIDLGDKQAEDALNTLGEHLLNKKLDDAISVVGTVKKIVEENPEQVLLFADQVNKIYNSRRFTPEQAQKNISQIQNNATAGYEGAIKSGDMPRESFFKPNSSELLPEVAQGRIADVQANLNLMRPGLGDKFAKIINPNATTFEEITMKAEDLINKNIKGDVISSVASKTKIPQVIKNVEDTTKSIVGNIEQKVKDLNPFNEVNRNVSVIDKISNQLIDIENNYAKIRKAKDYSKDALSGSRSRVVESGVLNDVVDESGKINTTEAVKQYRDLTLSGADNLVKNDLIREGSSITPDKLKTILTKNVMDSGLQGKALKTALNNIDDEISGLQLRNPNIVNIPLEVVQDAKINAYNGIDFNTDTYTKMAQKALARGYMNAIEETSNLPIKQVNEALSPFLKDIEYLENLNGKIVKGGKLGKYVAQSVGATVGAVAGTALSPVLGPVAPVITGLLGQEIGGIVKGNSLQSSLSGITTPKVIINPLLEEAKIRSISPRPALPAPSIGSPRASIGSGPAIELPAKLPNRKF